MVREKDPRTANRCSGVIFGGNRLCYGIYTWYRRSEQISVGTATVMGQSVVIDAVK